MKNLGVAQKRLVYAAIAVVAAGALVFGITYAVSVQQEREAAARCAVSNICD